MIRASMHRAGWLLLAGAAVLLGVPSRLSACEAVLAPSSLALTPGQTSSPVRLDVSSCFGHTSVAFVANVIPGLPGGPRVEPAPVVVTFPGGEDVGSASFRMATTTATPPGLYTVVLRADELELAVGLELRVEEPRGALAVQPPAVTAAPGDTTAALQLQLSDTNLSGVALRFDLVLPTPLAGAVALLPSPLLLSVPPGGTGGAVPFQLRIGPGAPPGTYELTLREAGTRLQAAFMLRIEQLFPTRVSVVPKRVSIPPGQTGPPLTLRVESSELAGVPLAFEAEWPAPLRGRAAIEPARLALTVPEAGGSARATFRVRCDLQAPPGTYTVALADREHGLRAVFELEIPPLHARVEVVPRAVALVPGEASPPLALRVSESNLAGFLLSFEAEMPPALARRCRTEPGVVRLTVPADASGVESAFQVACARDVPGGLHEVAMVEPGLGLRAVFTLDLGRPPQIDAVVPGRVAAGTVSTILRLEGSGFQPGAVISSPTPLLTFGPVRVLTAKLAETTVSVRSDAPPGPYRLDLTNPDGGSARDGATLLVHLAGGLGAPLGARTSAIVFPLPGALMSVEEKAYALGLLATTGTGTLTGVWLFDGVPFDRFVAHAEGGLPVHLRSTLPIPRSTLGPHRLQLAIESPQRFLSEAVVVTQVLDRSDRFRLLAPVDGAHLLPGPVRFRWTPMPGIEGYEIEIYREREAPALRRRVPLPVWTPGERDLAAMAAMAPGLWLWRVRPLFTGGVLGPFSAPWRFLLLPREARLSRLSLRYLPVRSPGDGASRVALAFGGLSMEWALPAQEPEPAPPVEEPAASGGLAWMLSGNEIFSQPGGDNLPSPPLDGTLALSGQVDRAGESSVLGATGSLSYTRSWPGGAPPQDNRSWTLHGARSLPSAAAVRNLDGQTGYVSPSFVSGCSLMTIGANKGGSEATLALPGNLSLSYYQTFDGDLAGLASGVLGSRETLEAGALAGMLGGVKLRAVGLELDKTGSELSPGGRGSLFGLLATYEGAHLQVVFEGAQSTVSPDRESFETERRGEAYHLNLSGTWAGWNGTATLDRAEAGFSNPANQGLNATGAPDQSSANLSLGHSFGRMALALALGHAEQGDTNSDTGNLNATMPVSSRATLTLEGRLSTTRSAAQDEWGLPASRVECRGGTLSLAESLGGTTLGQQLSYDETSDRYNPAGFSATTAAGVTASAAPLPRLTVSAGIQGNRTRAFGISESLLLTLDPVLTLPSQSLTVHPSASYNRSQSDLQPGATETETYGLILTWSPGWLRSLLSLEARSGWSRTRTEGLPDEGFLRSYTVSLTLREEKR